MAHFKLSNLGIAEAIAQVEKFLKTTKVNTSEQQKVLFAFEECLLDYQTQFGEEQSAQYNCTKQLSSVRIVIKVKGQSFNPFEVEEVDDDVSTDVLQRLLNHMGVAPTWRYVRSTNQVQFQPRTKKMSQLFALGLSLILGIVFGFLALLLPENIGTFLSTDLVTPIFSTLMGLLTAISGPMIFMSVITGMYSLGDMATFGKIGQKMITRFLAITALATILIMAMCLPFFDVQSGSGGTFVFRELFQLVLDIVPDNFFTPFTEGNPMQIIFLAIVIGISLIILNLKTVELSSILTQINTVIEQLMGTLSNFMPVFVFCSVFSMIYTNDFSVLFQSYKLIPLFFGSTILVLFFYGLWVSITHKVKLSVLIKKLLPTFAITVTTSSSAAAYQTNVKCCEHRLGIDRKIINVGIPLGQVIYMLGAVTMFFVLSICLAEVYNVTITLSWLVTAILITIILAVAAPPIAGGPLTCYTILFMQLGLPTEAVGIAIALNVILEFVGTATNIACLQLELVQIAGSLDLLDVNILRDKDA